MGLDISATIQANSEQINADDVIEPVTVTITNAEKGTSEQPVFLHLAEFPGRTFRPAKTVRRLLIAAWGSDASAYIGHRVTIYNDKTVRWGGQEVGGVRISHMSGIDKPLTISLTVSRGRRAPVTIQPLPDTPTPDVSKVPAAVNAINNAATLDALVKVETYAVSLGISGHPDVVGALEARKKDLA